MNVTTTSARQGKFETRFWHKVYEEEVSCAEGYFGLSICTPRSPLPLYSVYWKVRFFFLDLQNQSSERSYFIQ
jgi:hypothetical protein